jgi:hypothetical protein
MSSNLLDWTRPDDCKGKRHYQGGQTAAAYFWSGFKFVLHVYPPKGSRKRIVYRPDCATAAHAEQVADATLARWLA